MAQTRVFTLGGIGAPCCPCTSCSFCVTTCAGVGISGASVTIAAGGSTVFTGTTSITGCVSVGSLPAGPYTITASATGYSTYNATSSSACIVVVLNTTYAVCWTVHGCCIASLPDATITINGVELTTDSSGNACWTGAAAGTYPYTITATRFATYSGSVTLACGDATQNISVTMTPATGYACGPATDGSGNPNPYPIPTTLNLTSGLYGACTITYAGGGWTGSNTGSFTAACGCPSTDFILTYTMDSCWQSGIGSAIGESSSIGDYAECVAGSPFTIQGPCVLMPPGDTCAGKPNGTDILTGSGQGSGFSGIPLTVSSIIPFAATGTVPSQTCTGVSLGVEWFPGDTITITE